MEMNNIQTVQKELNRTELGPYGSVSMPGQ